MLERKKDGWGYCEDCGRAVYGDYKGRYCEEVKNRRVPPCCRHSFLSYYKIIEKVRGMYRNASAEERKQLKEMYGIDLGGGKRGGS